MSGPRPFDVRRRDAEAELSRRRADAWVATASADGEAYMVPLSIGWTGGSIVLVTLRRSKTAENLLAGCRPRVALGGTRDVVMIDAEVVHDAAVPVAPGPLLDTFAEQSGWDPRGEAAAVRFHLFELRPVRIQAWREENEIAGRTLMQDGAWLTRPSG